MTNFLLPREKARCSDCDKKAPIHYAGCGDNKKPCCRSFHYFVQHRVWRKATSNNYARQLCLYCLRKRLDRDMVAADFTKTTPWFNGHGYTNCAKKSKKRRKAYIAKMVEYANSGKNTSKKW
jgi:hypothetical protein